MDRLLWLLGGAAVGYGAAYCVARGRGQPGAVAPFAATHAVVPPGGAIASLAIGRPAPGYDPQPAIRAQNPVAGLLT